MEHVIFDRVAIGAGRCDMQTRCHQHPTRSGMQGAGQMKNLGEIGDPPTLGDAAANRRIELDVVHGTRRDQMLEIDRPALMFVAANRNRAFRMNLGLASDVVGRDRRFQEIDVVRSGGMGKPTGINVRADQIAWEDLLENPCSPAPWSAGTSRPRP